MKQAAKIVIEKIVNFFERVGHQRLAKNLLMLTDKQLDDIGFSRYKLQQGADGYPWRFDHLNVTENKKPVPTKKVLPAKKVQPTTIASDSIAKAA